MKLTRIGVFSDSHGNLRALKDALVAAGPLDAALFLGDYSSDARVIREAGIPLGVVRGNNDFGSPEADELTMEFDGVRVFCTHGHRYGVYFSTDRLYYAAKEKEADVALFGHTHRPLLENNGGMLIVNPGSVALPRFGEPTYALLTVRDGRANADIQYVYPKKPKK